jgi:DNA-binding transcriptional ArsR family regulator
MPQRGATLDRVFQALADPTRRTVVERLATGQASTSELARPFAMALPSFVQHLGVLERAGLVTSTKEGRVRTYRLVRSALDDADGWLAGQRRRWETRLDQLDELLVTLQEDQ